MKFFQKKLKNSFNNNWPYLFILVVVAIFFWKYFLKGLIPIPADFLVGTYHPWLNYNWGVSAGVPVKNPVTSDVISVIYPIRMYAFDLIKSGIKPLWNPLMLGGYPLLANYQAAIFSPTFFLYFLVDKANAWSIQVILQTIFCSIFMYLLLSNFKVSKLSSVIGGIIYAFSGFNMVWLEWNAHSLTASWIPLLVLFCIKYESENKLKYLVFISFTSAILIFSGYPQLFVYSFFTVLLLLITQKYKFKHFVAIGLFMGLGILLTSLQTLPAMELLSVSQRSSEQIDKTLAYLPYKHLINLFAPDYFGNQATGNFWGDGNYTNTVAYAGIISFVLASLAVVSTFFKSKTKLFFSVFVVGLLLTLKSPISEATYKFGIIGSPAASSTRSLIMVNFALAGLSAIGLDNITRIKSKHLYVLIIPWFVVFGALIYAIVNKNEVAYKNLILPIMLLGMISVLVCFFKIIDKKRFRLLLRWTIVALVVFEMFRFGWKYTPFSQKKYIFPETQLTDYLQKDKINRVHFSNIIPSNTWVPYNLSSLGGYDAVYPSNISKYIAVNNSGKVNVTQMTRHGSVDNSMGKMFDLSGTNRILSFSPDYEHYDDDVSEVFNDGKVYVYENKSAIGRVMIYNDWKVISDKNEIYKYLLSDEFDPKNEVIIDAELDIKPQDSKGVANAEISKYSSNEVLIDLETDRNSIVYLSDTFYPGWEVYIDGEKKEIIEANNAFRGVAVEPGAKKVRFIYNPQSFRMGLWLSEATFLFLLTILIYGLKKNSRRAS